MSMNVDTFPRYEQEVDLARERERQLKTARASKMPIYGNFHARLTHKWAILHTVVSRRSHSLAKSVQGVGHDDLLRLNSIQFNLLKAHLPRK